MWGERHNERSVCISKGSIINIPALTRALRRQAGMPAAAEAGSPVRCARGRCASGHVGCIGVQLGGGQGVGSLPSPGGK